jgi:hypothetical protein
MNTKPLKHECIDLSKPAVGGDGLRVCAILRVSSLRLLSGKVDCETNHNLFHPRFNAGLLEGNW